MAEPTNKTYSPFALRDVAQRFKILVEPTRLIIVGSLVNREMSVGSMAILVGMSESAVSDHLMMLRSGNFVEPTRDSTAVV